MCRPKSFDILNAYGSQSMMMINQFCIPAISRSHIIIIVIGLRSTFPFICHDFFVLLLPVYYFQDTHIGWSLMIRRHLMLLG
jgi:hypothetical protein